MDSASRNQQGNCDYVENSARPFFFFFFGIVVEFMQKQRSIFWLVVLGLTAL